MKFIYKIINKIIDFLNIDFKREIPNLEIHHTNGKATDNSFDNLTVRIEKLNKLIASNGITIDQAARGIRKAFGNNTFEDELIQERSDYFDQQQYEVIGIDWGVDNGNN